MTILGRDVSEAVLLDPCDEYKSEWASVWPVKRASVCYANETSMSRRTAHVRVLIEVCFVPLTAKERPISQGPGHGI